MAGSNSRFDDRRISLVWTTRYRFRCLGNQAPRSDFGNADIMGVSHAAGLRRCAHLRDGRHFDETGISPDRYGRFCQYHMVHDPGRARTRSRNHWIGALLSPFASPRPHVSIELLLANLRHRNHGSRRHGVDSAADRAHRDHEPNAGEFV